MFPIRTILYPTDFSAPSTNAFDLACSLARDYAARLIVLHVAPPPVIMYGEGVVPPPPLDCLDELRDELDRIVPRDLKVAVERRLVEGYADEVILRTAEEADCDLIVMGTHGRTGLGRLLMGSVAEQVVRRASCPVLTVKTPHRASVKSREPVGAGEAML